LFTRDFSKLGNTLCAIVVAVLAYVGVNAVFLGLSARVERQENVYPYKFEDWYRYLLPGLFEHRGARRIMLVGESAVRENLLYEEFNKAFPTMHTFQGGLSLGTIDDLLISLEYITKVYGRDALPEVMVLGVSPRFVANLPETRPFIDVLDGYSPYFTVEETPAGPRLQPKTQWQGWSSWARFVLFKQQQRYLGVVAALARSYLVATEEPTQEVNPGSMPPASPLQVLPVSLRRIAQNTLQNFINRWLSPYRYHGNPPMKLEGIRHWLHMPKSWWPRVHRWDPDANQQTVDGRLTRLRELVANKGIALYVINLPENLESRQLYEAKNYQAYLSLVQKHLGDAPFIDLQDMLRSEEFYDIVHATVPGAKRVTATVIRFIKDHPRLNSELAS